MRRLLPFVFLLAACGAPSVNDAGTTSSPTPEPTATDSATPTPTASATPSGSDGTPTRQTCTSSFGHSLSGTHGRLDGYLVSIVPPGSTSSCNGDSSHVHLQIQMNGAIYDVAVNVHDNTGGDVLVTEGDLALPDGAWSEGFHSSDNLDYVALGLHASDFSAMSESALSQKLENELASANHLSVFATTYNSSGVHDVHRQSGGNDGAIVVRPLDGTAHAIFFHFADQSF